MRKLQLQGGSAKEKKKEKEEEEREREREGRSRWFGQSNKATEREICMKKDQREI